jgi:hypothetical protein
MSVASKTASGATDARLAPASPATSKRRLVRHFVEMVAAMIIGMMVLGMLESLVLALLGYSIDDIPVAPLVLAMGTNMAIGMSVWMRHRGHGWVSIGEMDAAMYLAFAVLLVPFWAGVLSEDPVFGLGHVLMLPFMVVAMFRRYDEYAGVQHHRLSRRERGATEARRSAQ